MNEWRMLTIRSGTGNDRPAGRINSLPGTFAGFGRIPTSSGHSFRGLELGEYSLDLGLQIGRTGQEIETLEKRRD